MNSCETQLGSLPHLGLVAEPTPLIPAQKYSTTIGSPLLYLKRDDLIPVAFGGNKVRALDLIVADALSKGADTLITGAGWFSNHVRATAAVAAIVGMHCTAVYWGHPPDRVEGNLYLTRTLGAEIRFTGEFDRALVDRDMETAASEAISRGRKPYLIPRGGACLLAVFAHALSVRETLDQCSRQGVKPKAIIMAAGGCATLAGWLLGSSIFGADWRIEAFAVSRPPKEALARAIRFASEAANRLGYPWNPNDVSVNVHDGLLGTSYGSPSRDAQDVIAVLGRTEGVFLDPHYTGKAMAGYRNLLRNGEREPEDTAIFLHSGGLPSLFSSAVADILE